MKTSQGNETQSACYHLFPSTEKHGALPASVKIELGFQMHYRVPSLCLCSVSFASPSAAVGKPRWEWVWQEAEFYLTLLRSSKSAFPSFLCLLRHWLEM